LQRYPPRFRRLEQRTDAALVIRGRLSGLQRKTCEPIAVEAGVHRKPIQISVGAGKWDDEAVMAELRRPVAEELGDDRAVLILAASTFPKSGADSCGVGRHWCGRLGKPENCRRGISLAYAAAGGYAPPDRWLYLPEDWADDPNRRKKCLAPEEVEFRQGWRIAADLVERCGSGSPHGGAAGDDEFGRPAQFRAWPRRRVERYVLDVPGDTIVRDPGCGRPERRAGRGARPQVPSCRVDAWAARQPDGRRTRLTVRGGEEGPLRVDARAVRVRTKLERRRGPEERLVVMRTVEAKPETHRALSNAGPGVASEELVRVRFTRHRIEEVFGAGESGVGLGQSEVRSWVGWHHHRTLSPLAWWFPWGERRRVGGEDPSGDGVAGQGGHHAAASGPGAGPGADRRGGDAGLAAEGGGADLPLASGECFIPAAATATGYELLDRCSL